MFGFLKSISPSQATSSRPKRRELLFNGEYRRTWRLMADEMFVLTTGARIAATPAPSSPPDDSPPRKTPLRKKRDLKVSSVGVEHSRS
jgi:hypothetical protein